MVGWIPCSGTGPAVYAAVPPRLRRTRMVADAMEGNTWARDIGPDLQIETIREYLRLWTRISDVELQAGIRVWLHGPGRGVACSQ